MGTSGWGEGRVQTVAPFCILLLLNHKLYKMDGFLHLCQCGDCLRGRIGLRQALTPPLRPSTHTQTHTHYILHLICLEPAARETDWGILTYMYGLELEALHCFGTWASCLMHLEPPPPQIPQQVGSRFL